jgi:uncharacterized integral membrane protein
MNIRLILSWVLLVVLAVFVGLNWASARINLFWIVQAEMPVSIAIVGAGLLGFLAGWLMCTMRTGKSSK